MIKTIYCLGTSHTEGGGFHNDDANKRTYGHLLDKTTMSDMCYVGILDTLIKKNNNIKIYNIAKSGTGNARTQRILWNIINEKNFNKDEVLFLIEPSFIGRLEFWSNSINDWILCNYSNNKNVGPISRYTLQITQKHYKESSKILQNDVLPKVISFLKETDDEEHTILKEEMNLITFLNFLSSANLNHKIIHGFKDFIRPNTYDKYYIGSEPLVYNIFESETQIFSDFAMKNNLNIQNETMNKIADFHQGYFVNQIVARTIYNDLVKENYLDGSVIQIKNSRKDWTDFLKKLNNSNPLI